jgi:hypothetical protein
LCHTLPAFEALKQKWKEYIEDNPEAASIVQEGLDKLDDYQDRTTFVPAYILSMGKLTQKCFILIEY